MNEILNEITKQIAKYEEDAKVKNSQIDQYFEEIEKLKKTNLSNQIRIEYFNLYFKNYHLVHKRIRKSIGSLQERKRGIFGESWSESKRKCRKYSFESKRVWDKSK